MFRHLQLNRVLAVLDLETTGIDPKNDRVVELSILKIAPDGSRHHRTRRLNPEMPIPAEATAVHGITDADVANEPTFRNIAATLEEFLRGCDLCGFNLKRFDLRMLHAEFQRCKIDLQLEGRAILDPMEIYHRFERRDLSAAVHFYLQRPHEMAHSAEADVLATAEILDAMLDRYPELPRSSEDLHLHFKDPNAVDSDGKFVRVNGDLRFSFGKYRGESLKTVAQQDSDYLNWILAQDFFSDTKEIVRLALQTPQ